MEETLLSLNLTALFIFVCLVLPVYLFLARNSVFAWFDPLVSYIFFNSISTGLVIYLFTFQGNIRLFYFATFICSTISFIAGLILGNFPFKKEKAYTKIKLNALPSEYKRYSGLMNYFLYVALFILLFSNIILFVVKGTIPILSSNPGESKVLLYTGGFGIVRRINFIMTSMVLAIIFIKLFNPVTKETARNKIILIGCFLLTALIIISGGSKSALLEILTSFFPVYLINQVFKRNKTNKELSVNSTNNLSLINKYSQFALILGVFYMLLIVNRSVKSDIGATNESSTILTRFIASGDTFYFFYVYDIYDLFHENIFTYLTHLLNPLTSSLRITDYEFPIGAYILQYSIGTPLSAFGPNAQHPIEGLIYFGKYFFFLFSFGVGYLISWIRTKLLVKILRRPSQLNFFIYCVLGAKIVVLATESELFFLEILDMIIFGFPVFLAALVLKEIFHPHQTYVFKKLSLPKQLNE